MKILWFSCGATSAVACKLALTDNCRIVYFDIKTAHQDNDRFIKDCEKWYGQKIEIIRGKYLDQFDVIRKTKYVNGAKGARCTTELKRNIRKKFQKDNDWDKQVFGFEFSEKEIERSKRIPKELNPEFPLIEERLTKENCLGILLKAGIELPTMYKLGYGNNNCIGCVKGGKGYWNKIRLDFPEVFIEMAEAEREVGRSCLKDKKGLIFLDELDPKAGNMSSPLVADCGFFCGDTDEYI